MKKLIISLSLLAVWLGACNSEYDEPGKDQVAMNFNVTGHLGAPETRMTYEGNSDGELKVVWEKTPTADAIGLFNVGTSKNEKSTVTAANGNTATFSDVTLEWAAQPSGPTPVYAYYPHNSSASDMRAVGIDLSGQRATSTTEPFEAIREYDFMVATTQVDVSGNSLTTSESNQLDLHFHHLLHLVTFKISGLSSSDLGKISMLKLENTTPQIIGNNIFSTYGTVDLTNPSFPITISGGTSAFTLILDNLTINNATDVIYFNMLILPFKEDDSMSSCTITIFGANKDKRITKYFSPAFKAERGKHTLFDCTTGWEDVTN